MKYTEAWASVVSQNLSLKIATVVLAGIAAILGMVTLRLAFKEAIIIERGCYSKSLGSVKDEHTPQEIEAFLGAALPQRFDTHIQPVDGLLAPEELRARLIEQKEFEAKNMRQRVILNGVEKTSDGFKLDVDRIISVNNVRSAFRFPLVVKLESKARSQSNPYGLLLVAIKPSDTKSDSKKEN